MDSPERRNFTIAHELGHWILHRKFYLKNPERYPFLPRYSKPDYDDPREKEANKFASCLLVPERLLKPVRHAPAQVLAPIFGVSLTMMAFRLKNRF